MFVSIDIFFFCLFLFVYNHLSVHKMLLHFVQVDFVNPHSSGKDIITFLNTLPISHLQCGCLMNICKSNCIAVFLEQFTIQVFGENVGVIFF